MIYARMFKPRGMKTVPCSLPPQRQLIEGRQRETGCLAPTAYTAAFAPVHQHRLSAGMGGPMKGWVGHNAL